MDWLNMDYLTQLFQSYAPKVVAALLTLVIGFWVVGIISRLAAKAMNKWDFDTTISKFLQSLISVGLKILVLLSVAAKFGIETTSFIAIFSALAFAIGMALQGSLGHFASGVLILVFKPYKLGDLVEVAGGKVGAVEEIQIFNTILKTLDNKKLIVPNGIITNNVITNISGQGTIGVELSYGISYGDSIDLARQTILEVGESCPYILKEPAQGVVVAEHADSAVILATRPFCKSEHYWDTYFYMQEEVKKAFDNKGISIPFPQMDVHQGK